MPRKPEIVMPLAAMSSRRVVVATKGIAFWAWRRLALGGRGVLICPQSGSSSSQASYLDSGTQRTARYTRFWATPGAITMLQ